MSNPSEADATPITSIGQLADHIAAGCKPRGSFRIGTEHEKIGFRLRDLSPPPYDDESGDPGTVRRLLEGMLAEGGSPITDREALIGLKQELLPGKTAAISLEPGGQLELSGGLLDSLHETRVELDAHLAQVLRVGGPLGLGYLPIGFHPLASRDEIPWMPKSRYAIMRRYMPRVGSLGLDMMTRTCTVQVNLDYADEADMVRKLRTSLLLQPLATALLANSPFTEGRPNGFLSYRAQIWTDTDPDRSGMPAVFFEPGFGFERYASWLVSSVPMYFVTRGGLYIDVAGRSFEDFMAGRLDETRGLVPTIGDFDDHMTTVFTDVRLKRYLEMRGADAAAPPMMLALAAFWVGLLYDDAALAAAEALLRGMGRAEALALRDAVPRAGLAAGFELHGRRVTLRDLLPDVLAIAGDGLRTRRRLDADGRDETSYLAPLHAIASGDGTPAEHLLRDYNNSSNKDISRFFAQIV
ncbi:MAG TPA: glutamate--cysteine ligase [Acidisphaera sp.]|nr:glutamate--cysteine ligase [Acidisphaera sp.]